MPSASGKNNMNAVRKLIPTPNAGTEVSSLRDSVRVLSEVIGQLAERIDLLEAREALRGYRPVEAERSRRLAHNVASRFALDSGVRTGRTPRGARSRA